MILNKKNVFVFKKQYKKINKLFDKKLYNECIIEIDKILYKFAQDEINSFLLYRKAICYCRINEFDNSIETYKDLKKFDKDHLDIDENIATLYYSKKDYETAKKMFIELIKLGTDYNMIAVYLLNIFVMSKEYQAGLDYIENNKEKLLKFENDGDYLCEKARILYYLEKYKESKSLFEKSIVSTGFLFDYEYVGDCNYYLQNYQDAISCYKKVLKSDKTDIYLYYKIAKMYNMLNNRIDSRKYLKKYILKKRSPMQEKLILNCG